MSIHVGDGLSVARVPQQLHGVRDDGPVSVDVSLATGLGHGIAESLEARNRIVLDDLIDVQHLETVVQIPSQQGRGEQYLIAVITTHEHAPRSRHDVVRFGVSAHERTEILAHQMDVLEHGLHLGKVLAQFFRYANVTLDHTEHGSRAHIAQDLLRRHRPPNVSTSGKSSVQTPFYDRISSHLFPLAFPQLDDLDEVTYVGGGLSGLGEQFDHGIPVDGIDLFSNARATVEETTLELISRLRLAAPSVHPVFTYPFLSPVDLMSYGKSRTFGFPRQPFRGHLSVHLRRFGTEVLLGPPSRVPSHRHDLHERPQIQRVRVVSDDRATRTSNLSVLVPS